MFRRKPKTVTVLTVADRDHPGAPNTVEVQRGTSPRPFDRLEIISVSTGSPPSTSVFKVFINGRTGAATLQSRDGTFRVGQVLKVQEVIEEPSCAT